MDEKLHIVQNLYGEPVDRAALREALAESEELQAEYRALSQAKFQLDHRKRARPEQATLAAIFAAAEQASAGEAIDDLRPRRQDRAAVRPAARKRKLWRMVSVAVVVLFVGSVGLWQVQQPVATEAPASVAEAEAATADRAAAPATAPPAGASLAASKEHDPLAWDEASNVYELHRRLEMLQRRSAPGEWDAAVPLESLGGTSRSARANAGMQQASSRRAPQQ